MPRFPSFAQTIDECLTIDLSNIRKWGDLKENCDVNSRTYVWSKRGQQIASVGYHIECVNEGLKIMTLKYNYRNQPVEYQVSIVCSPSNLGIGVRRYFICPKTGNKCNKLISPSGTKYFFHRSAYDLLYDSQRQSKKYRWFNKQFGATFELDRLEQELFTKYRKTHNQGRPTPLLKKILKARAAFAKIDVREFERSLLT